MVVPFIGKADDRAAILGFIERRSATAILGPPDDLFVFYCYSSHGCPFSPARASSRSSKKTGLWRRLKRELVSLLKQLARFAGMQNAKSIL
jgi:hypothetical protein